MRRQKRNQQNSRPARLRILTVAQLQMLRDWLDCAQKCGPALQAAAISSMAEYKGAYYQTPHGLRRVFSKEQEAALFSKANLSLLTQKLKVQDPMQRPACAEKTLAGGTRGGQTNATGQP